MNPMCVWTLTVAMPLSLGLLLYVVGKIFHIILNEIILQILDGLYITRMPPNSLVENMPIFSHKIDLVLQWIMVGFVAVDIPVRYLLLQNISVELWLSNSSQFLLSHLDSHW